MQSSQPGIFIVGDGAGVTEAMALTVGGAIEQGRAAARAVGQREGQGGDVVDAYLPASRAMASAWSMMATMEVRTSCAP